MMRLLSQKNLLLCGRPKALLVRLTGQVSSIEWSTSITTIILTTSRTSSTRGISVLVIQNQYLQTRTQDVYLGLQCILMTHLDLPSIKQFFSDVTPLMIVQPQHTPMLHCQVQIIITRCLK